ncbi:hypothetical protein SUGI_1137280 [Cryptomeria japonica]|nr:hypothetical protein SUGI_1137280 [Cryptomeria japonica]
MEFKRIPVFSRTPEGYRLVTLGEVNDNGEKLRKRRILDSCSEARVLNGIARDTTTDIKNAGRNFQVFYGKIQVDSLPETMIVYGKTSTQVPITPVISFWKEIPCRNYCRSEVIVVMTGLAMMNAAITTQLLLSFFKIKGVVHYGIAGNGNSDYPIGDVTIPRQWAHTGLWNWFVVLIYVETKLGFYYWRVFRHGQGVNDELALESNGDYTRKIGHIHFANYSTEEGVDNLLNNVWYNPDEIFPLSGTPEVRQHAFWVNVSETYYNLAEQLKNITLESCTNSTTCLSTKPKIVKVERGCSASVYLDNASYRNFLHGKFNCTPIDMESAAVALVSLSMEKPFIIIRALSDLAGGSSAGNEASIFENLASKNAVIVVTKFFNLLSSVADKPTNFRST